MLGLFDAGCIAVINLPAGFTPVPATHGNFSDLVNFSILKNVKKATKIKKRPVPSCPGRS